MVKDVGDSPVSGRRSRKVSIRSGTPGECGVRHVLVPIVVHDVDHVTSVHISVVMAGEIEAILLIEPIMIPVEVVFLLALSDKLAGAAVEAHVAVHVHSHLRPRCCYAECSVFVPEIDITFKTFAEWVGFKRQFTVIVPRMWSLVG